MLDKYFGGFEMRKKNNYKYKFYDSIDKMADDIIVNIFDNQFSFMYGDIFMIDDGNLQIRLEERLLERVPNLVITHHDVDSKEDYVKQIMRICEIYNQNMIPYFIDFSKKSVLKKELKK